MLSTDKEEFEINLAHHTCARHTHYVIFARVQPLFGRIEQELGNADGSESHSEVNQNCIVVFVIEYCIHPVFFIIVKQSTQTVTELVEGTDIIFAVPFCSEWGYD